MLREKVKNIIILSLVCAGLLGISPISSAILNNHSLDTEGVTKTKIENNEAEQQEVIHVDNSVRGRISPVNNELKSNDFDEKDRTVNNTNIKEDFVNNDEVSKKSNADERNYNVDKNLVNPKENNVAKPVVDKNKDKMIYTDIEDIDEATLTPNEAENVLKKYDSSVDYRYMGSADDFEALKKDHRSGQVFLPKVPTDIGYYVEKGTNKIYYFHPSGYLEEAK